MNDKKRKLNKITKLQVTSNQQTMESDRNRMTSNEKTMKPDRKSQRTLQFEETTYSIGQGLPLRTTGFTNLRPTKTSRYQNVEFKSSQRFERGDELRRRKRSLPRRLA